MSAIRVIIVAWLLLVTSSLRADPPDRPVVLAGDYFLFVDVTTSRAGYPWLVQAVLKADGRREIVWDKTMRQGSASFSADFANLMASHKGSTLIITFGAYDVSNTPPDKFMAHMEAIAKQAREADIDLRVMTQRPARRTKDGDIIDPYNAGLVELAKRGACGLIDAAAALESERARRATLADCDPRAISNTVGGYPLTPGANRAVAREILRALGYDAEQLARAEKLRENMEAACNVSCTRKISFARYDALLKRAEQTGKPLDQLLSEALQLGIETATQPDPTPTSAPTTR